MAQELAMTPLEATSAAYELATENERLRGELRELLAALGACRGRVNDAITAERRRIERALHDGTQGRLVSLAMSLGLLESKLPEDANGARPIAREAREAVAAALAELRELSHRIYPAALAERGLEVAISELCDRAVLPVYLDSSLHQRLPERVETAGYFVVSEALTNAIKHAAASEVRVTVGSSPQRLVIQVVDDGVGGARGEGGSGLTGLSDRVKALGGRLVVSSPPGHGTAVWAEIPLPVGESPPKT